MDRLGSPAGRVCGAAKAGQSVTESLEVQLLRKELEVRLLGAALVCCARCSEQQLLQQMHCQQ